MSNLSEYQGREMIITTKHQKEKVVHQQFKRILGAHVHAAKLDTDLLGTFTHEHEREDSALVCAKKKCVWGMRAKNVTIGLASEGSFGPHPHFGMAYCDQEVICFIDKEKQIEVYETELSLQTNFKAESIKTIDQVFTFAQKTQFPSHALIVRPNVWSDQRIIFKDISHYDDLILAFKEASQSSEDKCAWIETDMRAHQNPSRMKVIKALSKKLAHRLTQYCPSCSTPGWGKVAVEYGLACEQCHFESKEIKGDIYGCVKCDHQQIMPPEHGREYADPRWCDYCNP